jgi:hypothetical protein
MGKVKSQDKNHGTNSAQSPRAGYRRAKIVKISEVKTFWSLKVFSLNCKENRNGWGKSGTNGTKWHKLKGNLCHVKPLIITSLTPMAQMAHFFDQLYRVIKLEIIYS